MLTNEHTKYCSVFVKNYICNISMFNNTCKMYFIKQYILSNNNTSIYSSYIDKPAIAV